MEEQTDVHRNNIFGNQDAEPEGKATINKRPSKLSICSSKAFWGTTEQGEEKRGGEKARRVPGWEGPGGCLKALAVIPQTSRSLDGESKGSRRETKAAVQE